MILFLTSSPCSNDLPEGVDLPCVLNEANDFVKNLSSCWKPESSCVIFCSDPDNSTLNDEMADTFQSVFSYHGMTISEFVLCDGRNEEFAEQFVAEADVILLAGGHVPTQNAFFQRIHLPELLRNFDGIVIGISAGSMNAAEIVYAQPELEGEALDPDYAHFISGLGLTKWNILPHYQEVCARMLDGRRLYEDITFEDSYGHSFLVLVDGSYVLEYPDGNHPGQYISEIHGDAQLIRNGRMVQICEAEETLFF